MEAVNQIAPQNDLLHTADCFRIDASRKLNPKTRSTLGQFLTPVQVAHFMASLFTPNIETIGLLDPGAGVGSLTAAFIDRIVNQPRKPFGVQVHTYEIDSLLIEYLSNTLEECRCLLKATSIEFRGEVFQDDFIRVGVNLLLNEGSLFEGEMPDYTHCIMNPPYKKIRSSSDHRILLRQIGVETSNLYSAFLAVAIKLLDERGELVAIVPRSFCNGVYFKPFRKLLLDEMALKHLHIFDSRNQAFKDDDVLQENIILFAVKGAKQGNVTITSCSEPSFEGMTYREVNFTQVVNEQDPDRFIHIAANDFDQTIVDKMSIFNHSLKDLEIDVCTGPVVDFRLQDDIKRDPSEDSLPLIYPSHIKDNYVRWPNLSGKKPNSIYESDKSRQWLMPNGWYVVTRRFSSKEERRRIVAALHDPDNIPSEKVGFENHLNVFHKNKRGLDPVIAKGLAVYLNSTLLDLYFRQFSGHTQVNATDLRMLHFPDKEFLINLGLKVQADFPSQNEIDSLLEAELSIMTEKNADNPLLVQQKIQEALFILEALALPRGQRNERSALTLLALLDLKPQDAWKEATAPLIGITPIMDFCRKNYGRAYASNTRETFRRQTMHQFVNAGIAVTNPDKPDRPVNSPKWCYQIQEDALNLIRVFGDSEWEESLQSYLNECQTLAQRYAKARKM